MPREPLPGTRVAEGVFQAKFMPINALISLHDFTPKLAPYPSFRAGAPQAVWCGAGPAMGAISNLFSRLEGSIFLLKGVGAYSALTPDF